MLLTACSGILPDVPVGEFDLAIIGRPWKPEKSEIYHGTKLGKTTQEPYVFQFKDDGDLFFCILTNSVPFVCLIH